MSVTSGKRVGDDQLRQLTSSHGPSKATVTVAVVSLPPVYGGNMGNTYSVTSLETVTPLPRS